MSKVDSIKNKYWVEFLQWYRGYKHKTELTNNSFDGPRIRPVEDIFWYWLTTEKASSVNLFLEQL